mgnify:CR=1 FL=1
MVDVRYRNASREDIALILEFIKKLADYEGRLDEVTATEEDLSKWIFDEKIAEVIFVLEDGREVGFALFYKAFSTYIAKINVHLEDMFVEPEYRGRGYGKGLLKEIAKIIVERGYGRFEWTAVSWNSSAIDFYLSIGAEQMDWELFHLEGENLKKLAE